jgi:8-oxo-dGTP diphosphatase
MKKPTQTHPRVGTGILLHKDGKILYGLRKGSHGAGTWCPPGGGLDMNETWEACARREVKEETGLRIKNVQFLGVSNDIFKKERKHFITIEFTAEWVSGEPRVMEPDKCERWEWFPWDKPPKPIFQVTKNFLKNERALIASRIGKKRV